jgi:hypothetical protein
VTLFRGLLPGALRLLLSAELFGGRDLFCGRGLALYRCNARGKKIDLVMCEDARAAKFNVCFGSFADAATLCALSPVHPDERTSAHVFAALCHKLTPTLSRSDVH